MRKTQPSIIMLVIIVTTILGVASSLALAFLQNRSEPAQDVASEEQPLDTTQVVTVENVPIIVNNNPDDLLFLMPNIPAPGPEAAPTNEPTVQVEPTQAQQEPQPTQAPTDNQNTQPQATTAPSGSVNRGVAPVIFRDYTVQATDSLYNITRQLDTSITLMAVHGIDQTNLVQGTVIRVPVGNPEYCPGLRPYAIGEGDTVFAIATRRNTTVENIRGINGLNADYDIKAGEILCVP